MKDKNIITKRMSSDPYFRVGLCKDGERKMLKDPKPHKSKVIKNNTSPKWTEPKWTCSLPAPNGADAILIEINDWDLIGKDDEIKRIVIPLKGVATDSRNYFEVVREYGYTSSSEHVKDEVAPASFNSSIGSVKVAITFEGKLWASTKSAEEEKFVASVSESKLDMSKIKAAVDTFLKSADAKNGYTIKSKAQLQNFLEKSGLIQTILDFDAFSMKNLSVFHPDKLAIESYHKSRIADSVEWKDQQLDLLWAMCDADGNGAVEFSEIIMVLAMLSNSDPVERGELAFKLMDKDNSGSLSRQEVKQMQTIYLKSYKILYRQEFMLAVNSELLKKGVWLNSETTEAIEKFISNVLDGVDLTERLTTAIFSLADEDKSGDVSKEEYIKFLKDPANAKAINDIIVAFTIGISASIPSGAAAIVARKRGARSFY